MNKNNKKFISTIVFVAVFNLVFVFAAYFLSHNIGLEKKSILDIKNQLSFYEKRIENIKEIEKSLAGNKENFSKIKLVFLDKELLIDFIKELEYLAKQTGVFLEMRGVTVSSGVKEKPLFNFKLEGSFSSVYGYLVLLENDRYQLGLEKVYIQKPKQGDLWKANLEVRLLSFKNVENKD
jgi:hypothetical protein